MALPWLESHTVWGDEPTRDKPASEAPVRLAVLFSGNGFHSREWWAKGRSRSGCWPQASIPSGGVVSRFRARHDGGEAEQGSGYFRRAA